MVHKRISIYGNLGEEIPIANFQLFLELSHSYMALLVKDALNNQLLAIELFEFDSILNNWDQIFHHIQLDSKILDQAYGDNRIFYNFPEALLIPSNNFSMDSIEGYLNAIYGDNNKTVLKHEKIVDEPSFINAYRIKKEIIDIIENKFTIGNSIHSYTSIIENVFLGTAANKHIGFLKVQFYQRLMVVVLLKDGALQLIQSYTFQNADTIAYHLSNIIQQFDLLPQDVEINISGLIYFDGEELACIRQLFTAISFDNISTQHALLNDNDHYPLHFFSPFIKLLV